MKYLPMNIKQPTINHLQIWRRLAHTI